MTFTLNTEILAPAAVLVSWTLFMLLWMLATRMPAFKKAGVDLVNAPPGGRYVDVESEMPPRVNWIAHNHNHLMEQPTIFYPLVLILAITGAPESAVMWAWAYTGLRIAHSLWQCLFNSVPVRFLIFLLATACLFVLAYHALMATLG